jgi:hypothetical protein
MKYPIVEKRRCVHCDFLMTLQRHGTGKKFRGQKDYWYSSDHLCPKLENAGKALKQLSQLISK